MPGDVFLLRRGDQPGGGWQAAEPLGHPGHVRAGWAYYRSSSCIRGAVVTGVLTQRGLLNRETESFGAVSWGPVVTPTFPTGPQTLSLEPESAGRVAESR